jgi:hypothetical protein
VHAWKAGLSETDKSKAAENRFGDFLSRQDHLQFPFNNQSAMIVGRQAGGGHGDLNDMMSINVKIGDAVAQPFASFILASGRNSIAKLKSTENGGWKLEQPTKQVVRAQDKNADSKLDLQETKLIQTKDRLVSKIAETDKRDRLYKLKQEVAVLANVYKQKRLKSFL